MGHAIEFLDFEVTTSHREIQDRCDMVAIEEGDYHHKLNENIQFIDKCFDIESDAYDYLDNLCDNKNHYYENYAVKYKDLGRFTPSAKLRELEGKCEKKSQEYIDFANKGHFDNVKSATIGCSHCGSKIATAYLKGKNCCPVCKAELRPASTLERIEKMRNAYIELQKKCKDLEKKERIAKSKNAKERWLVRIEYHV